MRLSHVVHVIGAILRVYGVLVVVPIVVALYHGEGHDAVGFVVTGAIITGVGVVMRAAVREPDEELRRIEALAVVAVVWLLAAHLSAIPYIWAGLDPIDAAFESMSSMTTTGATTFPDFSRFGKSIFFWRAFTQWLGGMGVIALFVAILPRLGIAGRRLFFAEAPGPTDEKITPQVRKTAAVLWRLYAALTFAQVVALLVAGFSWYDAVCHAFTTLAAGGFSPHPLSLAGYSNPAAEWIIILFMFIAGANFAMLYRVFQGRVSALWRDEEFRVYAGIVLTGSGFTTFTGSYGAQSTAPSMTPTSRPSSRRHVGATLNSRRRYRSRDRDGGST